LFFLLGNQATINKDFILTSKAGKAALQKMYHVGASEKVVRGVVSAVVVW